MTNTEIDERINLVASHPACASLEEWLQWTALTRPDIAEQMRTRAAASRKEGK